MDIRGIKKLFMTYRNGIISDTLRSAGFPYKVIFGLNLPQLTEIARMQTAPAESLAKELWADREVRESRLLAPFLMPRNMGINEILNLCSDIRTREEADILAFRWLRYHADADKLAERFESMAENEQFPYLAEAIRRFL